MGRILVELAAFPKVLDMDKFFISRIYTHFPGKTGKTTPAPGFYMNEKE